MRVTSRSGRTSLAVGGGAVERDADVDHEPSPQVRRNVGLPREPDQPHRRRQRVGHRLHPPAVRVEHGRRGAAREVEAAAVDPGDREQANLHAGHHTEVALAAAQRPEQVGVLLR